MGLFGAKRYGLAQEIMKIHDLLLKDMIRYFEKGSGIRGRLRKARQVVSKSMRLSKKKKINALEVLQPALNEFKQIEIELNLTREALGAVFSKLDRTLKLIEEERIKQPLAMIERSRELIRLRRFDEARQNLEKIKTDIQRKMLANIRNIIFGGTYDEVRNLKQEIRDKAKATV
ncbi:MAG: hypothetical protein EHM45_09500 [Desulfobacteraceae bacterium]|nr:MAG: hypothetical protein EHM45_09500 [Desulfobacteraceae bacterium]